MGTVYLHRASRPQVKCGRFQTSRLSILFDAKIGHFWTYNDEYLTFFNFKKKYTNLVSKIKFQPQPDLHQPPEHTGLSEIYFTPLVGS